MSKQLEKVRLASLVKSIKVEEWKELMFGSKLLDFNERKRYYKISLVYEK